MICKLPPNGTLVFGPGHFLADNPEQLRVVLLHRGIYLTLDSSGNNAIGSPLSFGAWMDHAGFFVAPSGIYTDTDGVDGKERARAARMVVAAGERTGSRPAANAVWRGSMVGTALEGEAKDHILRGDAELRFDTNSATLDAHFFNIRDYDNFGAAYTVEDLQDGPRNRLRFKDIPVAEDGRYSKGSGFRNHIRGAFYGEGHAETAGTFEELGFVIGAFGAKQVTPN